MPLADLGEGQTMYSVRPCAADWLEVLEWGLSHPETAPLFGIDRRKIMKTQSYTGSPEGSVAKSGWLVTCLRDLERGVEA